MKKFLTLIIIVGVLVGGFTVLTTQEIKITALEGKTDVATRGDLTVPITASGRIQPKAIAKIKSKASGEVLDIPFEEGEMVKVSNKIVLLDQRDETRRVLQAKSDLKRAEYARAQAVVAKQQREDAGIPLAQARVAQATARADRATQEYELRKKNYGAGGITDFELRTFETNMKEALAAKAAAEAELIQAELGPKLADVDISVAEEAIKNAEKMLEDAEQRFEETTVVSPIDGMLLKRYIEVGEVIQSATQSFTGGTVLIDIADVSEIYAMVNVDEADIGLVRDLAPASARPGPKEEGDEADLVELPEGTIDTTQEVTISIESFPEEDFFGVIERISPQSEIVQAIATFKVAIRITSENRNKLVGLLNTHAEAKFTAKSAINQVLVSYDAVQKDPNSDKYGVYVPTLREDGKTKGDPKFVPCKFGVDDGLLVEVINGIDEGQEVYTKLPIKTKRQRDKEQEEQDDD